MIDPNTAKIFLACFFLPIIITIASALASAVFLAVLYRVFVWIDDALEFVTNTPRSRDGQE